MMIRLGKDVQIAVTVKIPQQYLVNSLANGDDLTLEVAATVPVPDKQAA